MLFFGFASPELRLALLTEVAGLVFLVFRRAWWAALPGVFVAGRLRAAAGVSVAGLEPLGFASPAYAEEIRSARLLLPFFACSTGLGFPFSAAVRARSGVGGAEDCRARAGRSGTSWLAIVDRPPNAFSWVELEGASDAAGLASTPSMPA